MSRLDLLAGPNGAGKTTFFERIIEPDRPGLPFVNADRIAAQRFPADVAERSYEAATIAAKTRQALIDARLDFCTETVFSHPSKADLIHTATAAGYDVALQVIMIPFELSGPRVAARVQAGGHEVPMSKLAARYQRIWPLVAGVVPTCWKATFYDNSTDSGPNEIASFRTGTADYPPRWPTWAPTSISAL
ncbi:MAG: AAA family ATPase [Actinobacteria bacterium]|nr:AAA family ATPase [Actinomycetota bacterium]